MKVVVTGEMPGVTEVGQLCMAAGHQTDIYLIEEFRHAVESRQLLEQSGDAEVAIDLYHESKETKRVQLQELVTVLSVQTLILSSVLPVSATEAAGWIVNSERLVGFALVPPVTVPGLVEITSALQTSKQAMEQATDFWRTLDLSPVIVADGPGLVRARTICCVINEATSALMEGVASASDIDTAMRLGTNYPYGPFEWADIIGLDAVLGVMIGLYEEWGEDRYRPSPLLKRMVLAGRLGQKAGRGFYDYGPDGERVEQ